MLGLTCSPQNFPSSLWHERSLVATCELLVAACGIEPRAPALEGQSPSHWTTREVPRCNHFWDWFPKQGDFIPCTQVTSGPVRNRASCKWQLQRGSQWEGQRPNPLLTVLIPMSVFPVFLLFLCNKQVSLLLKNSEFFFIHGKSIHAVKI